MSFVSTIRLPVAERCGMRKLRQSPGLSSNFVKPMINKSTQRRYSIAKRLRLVVRASTVFYQLSTGLEAAWTKLRNKNVLTKANVKEPMQDIRRTLLEADVNLPVVRKFVNTISEKAVGTEVVRGVRLDQQLVKVANDELVSLMGGAMAGIDYANPGPTVILMVGLQGVGKTTACEKLGDLLGGNRQ